MWVQGPTAGFNSTSYWRGCIIHHCRASVTAPLHLLHSTGDALLCSVTATQQQKPPQKTLPYLLTLQEFYYTVLAQTKILCQYTLGTKLLLENINTKQLGFLLDKQVGIFITVHYIPVAPQSSQTKL